MAKKKKAGRRKQVIKNFEKIKYSTRTVYKYPELSSKKIKSINSNYNKFKNVAKEITSNKLSLRQFITNIDLRRFRGKDLSESEIAKIKQQYNIIDKPNIKNKELKEFYRKRDYLIKKGYYGELRQSIWKENYIKALKNANAPMRVINKIKNLDNSKIDSLSKLVADIPIYYLQSDDEIEMYEEIIRDLENKINKINKEGI